MLAKGPLTSHNFLKIIIQETLLKLFFTSTYIMAQLGCRLRRARMPKGWPHNLQGSIPETNGGIGALETAPKGVKQWND
jgi:hypothetical protein